VAAMAGAATAERGWEASVFSKKDNKKIRKTFLTKAEAKTWRDDANAQLAKRGLRAPKPTTVAQAGEAWEKGAGEGTMRNRSGDVYKPSALRSYEQAMRLRVLPLLGSARLADIRRLDVQALVIGCSPRG
jgi:integrase